MLPSKYHGVPKVHLKRRPDVTVGLLHRGMAEWACLLACPRVTDDEWTNSRTAFWSMEFSRTLQCDLGAYVKTIHNSGLIDDLWT